MDALTKHFKKIPVQEFLATEMYKETCFKYALIYYYDCMVFDTVENIQKIELENLIQGWIFGPDHQIYLFSLDNEVVCQRMNSTLIDAYFLVDEEQLLDSRFKHLGKSLLVKKYWIQDEDSQTFVGYQQLYDLVR